jgi:hypothetical protein
VLGWTKGNGSAQVRFRDVKYSFPSVKALGREYFVVLGQTQSRETIFQVAHVGNSVSASGEDGGKVWSPEEQIPETVDLV